MQQLLDPTRRDSPEYLDSPYEHLSTLEVNLRDIRCLNRWFGGTSLAVRYVAQALEGRSDARVLDVATGSADIPLAVRRWSLRNGVSLDIVASDVSDAVLKVARKEAIDSGIRVARADATALPWRSGQFDVVMLCLALHHCSRPQAVSVLGEMWRVASRAIVVTDLRRSYLAWMSTWLVTHAVTSNELTRHDGPLSVLRAYTVPELRELASDAGIPGARVSEHPLFRLGLIAMKPEAGHD